MHFFPLALSHYFYRETCSPEDEIVMVVNRKTVLNKYLERTAFVAGHTDCLRQNPFLRQCSGVPMKKWVKGCAHSVVSNMKPKRVFMDFDLLRVVVGG